jgi:hypothetical protein
MNILPTATTPNNLWPVHKSDPWHFNEGKSFDHKHVGVAQAFITGIHDTPAVKPL